MIQDFTLNVIFWLFFNSIRLTRIRVFFEAVGVSEYCAVDCFENCDLFLRAAITLSRILAQLHLLDTQVFINVLIKTMLLRR